MKTDENHNFIFWKTHELSMSLVKKTQEEKTKKKKLMMNKSSRLKKIKLPEKWLQKFILNNFSFCLLFYFMKQ